MVALQILVLTVGVRILLGELQKSADHISQPFFLGSFEYRFSSSPSQGGETGSTPVGAKMKRLIASLFITFFLLAVVSAADITPANNTYFPVETEVVNRTATTYFVYAGINSVEIINADKKNQKKKLKKSEYIYNKNTACITFKNQLPYENCIAKITGIPSIPYSCYLNDFEGSKSDLLVILNNLTAVEKKDYVYDPNKKLITFRPDIDIGNTSYYMVYYVQTSAGVVSKTIANDFNDTIAELHARHNQELFGGPLVIYKDRTGVPISKVEREVGFKLSFWQPRVCTICETYENNQKIVTVLCYYKNKYLECTENKIVEYRY